MIWFIAHPDRLEAERRAVEALAAVTDWLVEADWGLTAGGRVRLRFAVLAGGRAVRLEMRYPEVFPFTPPEVVPLDGLRLSDHQYRDGSLCLEHRPDNWRPEVTGADLIRSARDLIEADAGEVGGAQALPSAHELSPGQALRATYLRHLVGDELREVLACLPEGRPVPATMRVTIRSETATAWVERIGGEVDGWRDPSTPDLGRVVEGVAVKVAAGGLSAPGCDGADPSLPARLAAEVEPADTRPGEPRFVLVGDGEELRLLWRILPDGEYLHVFANVALGGAGGERLGYGDEALAAKEVAIVGCGSAGSKIAAALARAGVGAFLLVDDDVLLRGNLVRNDLDWTGLGEHKVDAVAARLRLIRPSVRVDARVVRLAGQESGGTAAATLARIARCDLVVDAAADAGVFNLLSSVAVAAIRSLVWLEVYEGGIGGMVARHLPGRDPAPQDMRSAYLAWCQERRAPWTGRPAGAYAGTDDNGVVLVADDADVGVIAAHAARLALDALCGGDAFPHSVYVIGLKAGWIFGQPFEAFPVEAAHALPAAEAGEAKVDDGAVAFLVRLLEGGLDEDPAP